ncbi:acyl carrier protein [Jannaschia formosa]|uniref:acyl carrier protein n=1 Tax=Jannaschia formosa TaxID=2259592 RepID=UPI000E1B83B9|nr:acyl carrier protein [Jannaschia formosa]TFL16407.1 acyl carrier protein [Jannaschia formosa]
MPDTSPDTATLTRSLARDAVLEALVRVLDLHPEQLTDPDAPIDAQTLSDLNGDSLDAVEIVMDIEEQLGIELDDAEIDDDTTVAQLIEMAEART